MNRTSKLAALTVTTLLGLSGLAACGSPSDMAAKASSSAPSPSSAASSSAASTGSGSSMGSMAGMIMIRNYTFTSPASVKPGARVMVMNQDSEAHTVTSDASGKFDVKIDPGRTAMLTAPSEPGTYAFHCAYHADMHGSLTVG